MNIGKKLFITYCILLITVFVVTGITFRVLLQQYLITEARTALKTEAQAIAGILEKIPIYDGKARPNLLAKREMRIRGQFIESKVIILNNDRKVIYNNFEENDKEILKALVNNKNLSIRQYVVERVPILSKNGEVKGHVILFAKVDDLNRIDRLLYGTQIISLIAGGSIAIILSIAFQSGLTEPIRKLKNYMTNFTFRDSNQELKIDTGDEIEELAECFSAMVQKLKRNDVQQKSFIQNASHELKTPLMSIQGYAEAIKDGVVQGIETQESLDVIIGESKRLKKIVDEMIYLTKLDNVDETFDFEKVSIQEIIYHSIKSVKALAGAKGINIKAEGDCPCEGSFDKEKLARAIINILSNGLRYAEKEIAVKCKAHDNYIDILITDDGEGFQNGEESKVFERFYKGEKGGTGIGLAIANAIITGHNGRVEAFNAIPNGAAFKITLPVTQPAGGNKQ